MARETTGLVERLRGLIERLTGGRPMRCDGLAFVDVVSGRNVFYFTDRLGRHWLAEGPSSLFRVRAALRALSEEPSNG